MPLINIFRKGWTPEITVSWLCSTSGWQLPVPVPSYSFPGLASDSKSERTFSAIGASLDRTIWNARFGVLWKCKICRSFQCKFVMISLTSYFWVASTLIGVLYHSVIWKWYLLFLEDEQAILFCVPLTNRYSVSWAHFVSHQQSWLLSLSLSNNWSGLLFGLLSESNGLAYLSESKVLAYSVSTKRSSLLCLPRWRERIWQRVGRMVDVQLWRRFQRRLRRRRHHLYGLDGTWRNVGKN